MANTKITFEDRGQDFLTWTITPEGKIIDCEPFQFSTWKKYTVLNTKYQVGGKVKIRVGKVGMTIQYPIEKVETLTA